MSWTAVPIETGVLYSQIGLRLVDEFTGAIPGYPVTAELEYLDSNGEWQPTEIEPTVTPSGMLSFPGLGRSADATVSPIVRYRVLISSEFYRPAYLRTDDSIEVDVHPYDNNLAPAVIPGLPQTVVLLPSPNYPYPAQVRVVRGQTLDFLGEPIANTEVTEGIRERVLSDERGVFKLPLRWPLAAGPVAIDAVDHRTGRTDLLNLVLPGDLFQSHIFTLT